MKGKIEVLIKELEDENWRLSKELETTTSQHMHTRGMTQFNLNLKFINKLKEIIK